MQPMSLTDARRKVWGNNTNRQCRGCGKRFHAKTPFRVYCSDSCRRHAYYERTGK